MFLLLRIVSSEIKTWFNSILFLKVQLETGTIVDCSKSNPLPFTHLLDLDRKIVKLSECICYTSQIFSPSRPLLVNKVHE